jgi:hypothetical protein
MRCCGQRCRLTLYAVRAAGGSIRSSAATAMPQSSGWAVTGNRPGGVTRTAQCEERAQVCSKVAMVVTRPRVVPECRVTVRARRS